jgi:DNA helicase HerA-like ATPase
MLNVDDLLQTVDGKGAINILAADELMQSPKVYSTLLLWLLSELYERLPEVGDRDKPKLVFFFDEAHLCSPTRRSRCSRRSSRSCGSSARRAWASSS